MDFTGDTTPPKPSTGHSYKGNLTSAYWVGAKDIEIGHRLIDDKGNYQTVISIHTEQTPLNSYNLEVDTDHTFFIKGVDGKKHTLRIHDADPNAPINSNARNGWVARWQVGQQYYDPVNGNLAHRQAHNKRSPNYDPTVSNNTHIPIKQPTKEQMDFMRYLEE